MSIRVAIMGITAAVLLLLSCKEPLMKETPMKDIPHLDKVVVTFVRSSIMAPTTKSGLWDRDTFIGEIKARSYVQYETTPGEHLFLASSEVWSYLSANLQGGRNYVVKAQVVPGGNNPRIVLEPVRPGGRTTREDIDEWFEDLDGYEPDDKVAEEYVKTKLGAVKKAVEKYDNGRISCETIAPGDAW